MTGHSIDPSSGVVDSGRATDRSSREESNIRRQGRLRSRLLKWWSLAVAAALLFVIAPPVLLLAWLAKRRNWVYPPALWGGRTWLRLSGLKVHVTGKENLDPAQPYVFIANHRSYLDTATIFCYIGRRIGLLAKKELLRVPVLGLGMRFVNVMAIDRSNRERAAKTTREATDRIRKGISFAVFAEGTRAGRDELLPFKKGGFYMALQAGVPIVPVAIKNTDKLMGKGTGEASTGTIEMSILPPVDTRPYASDKDVQELIERVHASVAAELGIAKPSASGRTTPKN